MSVIEKRSEQSIHSIQQTVVDHRATARELQEAREALAAQDHEITVLKHIVAKQNNDLATKEAEKAKLQFALDAVVRELSATKAAAGDIQGHNARLKRDLAKWSPAAVHSATNTPSILQTVRAGTAGGAGGASPLTPTRPATEASGGRSALRAGGNTHHHNHSTVVTPNTTNYGMSTYRRSPPQTYLADGGALPSRPATVNTLTTADLMTTTEQQQQQNATASPTNNNITVPSDKNTTTGADNNNNTNANHASSYLPTTALSTARALTGRSVIASGRIGGGGGGSIVGSGGSYANVNGNGNGGVNGPLALYLQKCLDCDLAPHSLVVKSLYKADGTLTAGDARSPISFRQLSQLIDTIGARRYIPTIEAQQQQWPTISRLEVVVEDDCEEAKSVVAGLIELLSATLTSLSVSDVDDRNAAAVAGAIAVSPLLCELELPNLKVTDEGMQCLMKIVCNRDVAATAAAAAAEQATAEANGLAAAELSPTRVNPSFVTLGAVPPPAPTMSLVGTPIAVAHLDLSQTQLFESDTFFLIKGTFIRSLSFKNCIGLQDKFLGEVIMSSPNLEFLDLTGCTSLTQDAMLFIGQAKNLRKLVLVNCAMIHNVRLNSVTELTTDFRGVTHFVAPELEKFTNPLEAFSCVTFDCPKLTSIAIANTTLSQREFNLLGDCSALTSAQFINCRTSGFRCFLQRMRRLTSLSIRCCKGIVDADVECLGSTIEDLDLTECFCLTDKLAQKVGAICRKLRRLTLKRCSGVSDTGLFFLAQCPELEFLNALGMRKVTVEGLRRVCQQVVSLNHIIHETFMSTTIRVDRTDDEETIRIRNTCEEREVVARRQNAALAYNSRAPVAAAVALAQQIHQMRMDGTLDSPSRQAEAERHNGWTSNVRPPTSGGVDGDAAATNDDTNVTDAAAVGIAVERTATPAAANTKPPVTPATLNANKLTAAANNLASDSFEEETPLVTGIDIKTATPVPIPPTPPLDHPSQQQLQQRPQSQDSPRGKRSEDSNVNAFASDSATSAPTVGTPVSLGARVGSATGGRVALGARTGSGAGSGFLSGAARTGSAGAASPTTAAAPTIEGDFAVVGGATAGSPTTAAGGRMEGVEPTTTKVGGVTAADSDRSDSSANKKYAEIHGDSKKEGATAATDAGVLSYSDEFDDADPSASTEPANTAKASGAAAATTAAAPNTSAGDFSFSPLQPAL